MASPIVMHLPTVTFTKITKKISTSVRSLAEGKLDAEKSTITITPVLVDFGRLLKGPNRLLEEVVPGISNTDLLHGSATLYGLCLSEVTDDIIYPTLCEKWSKTLLMIRDEKESCEKVKRSLKSVKTKERTEETGTNDVAVAPKTLQERNKDLKQAEADERFVNIFSDDSDSSEEEDEEEEDNFMSGVDEFLQNVDARKEARARLVEDNLDFEENSKDLSALLGIENRLLGCATFERSYEKPGHRVIQLTLIAMRKKFRGYGIGHFMMKQLHDATITGGSDVIVVNADNNAIEFFEREGYSADVLMNSQYAHIGDVWFNCKRMCYLPSFSSTSFQAHKYGDSNSLIPPDLNLREMELELALWREKSLQAYQSHSSIVQRMRQEILMLRARIGLQDEIISRLQAEVESSKDIYLESQQENLRNRLSTLKGAMNKLEDRVAGNNEDHGVSEDTKFLSVQDHMVSTNQSENTKVDTDNHHCSVDIGDEDENDTLSKVVASHGSSSDQELPSISDLFDQTCISSSSHQSDLKMASDLPPITFSTSNEFLPSNMSLLEIKHCFLSSMECGENNFSGTAYNVINVTDVIAAALPLGITSRFKDAVADSHDSDIIANLYFCGNQPEFTSERVTYILRNGFSVGDFAQSQYGKGLHFSRYPRAAARFSPSGLILVAKVCLGMTQTITSMESDRKSPPDGFDSILTQGRLSLITDSNVRSWNVGHSEYIVFRHDQALPLALIKYNMLC